MVLQVCSGGYVSKVTQGRGSSEMVTGLRLAGVVRSNRWATVAGSDGKVHRNLLCMAFNRPGPVKAPLLYCNLVSERVVKPLITGCGTISSHVCNMLRVSKSWPQGTIYPSRIIKESHRFCLTSSRWTRKVTLLPRLAVSFPSFVVSRSPFGGRMGHCCFIAVYISFTPLVQLFNTTLRYLWKENGNNFRWTNWVWKNCRFVLKSTTLYTPCAVEVVLTLAAASGDHGMIKPEGRAAGPVHAAFVSIITAEHKVGPLRSESVSTCVKGNAQRKLMKDFTILLGNETTKDSIYFFN